MCMPGYRAGNSSEGAGALTGRVGAVKVVAAPFEDGHGGGDGGKEGGGVKTAPDEEKKEAELEKRRQDRAAQIEAK